MEFTTAQRRFLDRPSVAILSTVGPDGEPHAAAMWFLRDDDRLLMLTGAGSQKQRNMERDPRVAVVVDHRDQPYYALTIRGHSRVDPMPLAAVRTSLAERYLVGDRRKQYLDTRLHLPGALFAIEPERTLEYGDLPLT